MDAGTTEAGSMGTGTTEAGTIGADFRQKGPVIDPGSSPSQPKDGWVRPDLAIETVLSFCPT